MGITTQYSRKQIRKLKRTPQYLDDYWPEYHDDKTESELETWEETKNEMGPKPYKDYPYVARKHWGAGDKAEDIIDWLKEQNINFITDIKNEENYTDFYFQNEDGALMFKLIWC